MKEAQLLFYGVEVGKLLFVDRAIVPLDDRAVVVIFQEKFFVRRIIIEDDKVTLLETSRGLPDR